MKTLLTILCIGVALASEDIRDGALCDAITTGKVFLKVTTTCVKATHFTHYSISKNSSRMLFAEKAKTTPCVRTFALAGHILQIVPLRSNEQMVRVAAGRVVAFVANDQSRWHLDAVMKFIGNPVCWLFYPIDSKPSVTPLAVDSPALPFPAFVRLPYLDAHPEPLRHWNFPNMLRDFWFKVCHIDSVNLI